MKEALKLALDLAIMHHSDEGYAELRSKVRQLAKEALAQDEQGSSQEPVAWRDRTYGTLMHQEWLDADPLYTTPPQRPWGKPWVSLTDEQREECTQSPFTEDNYQDIEDKLKELNT